MTTPLGTKIEERNLRSMRSSLFWLLLVAAPLLSAPDRKIALEEMRLEVGDVASQLKGQKSEIDLLHDELHSVRKSIDSLKEEKHLSQAGELALEKEKGSALEKRVSALEKSSKTLIADLKTLKDHLNSSTEMLAKCEERLVTLDQQLSSDVKTLKSSLQSMLALMQGEARTYTVQPGDSLGKIAVENRVTLKMLKELNGLTSDQIVVGQKLVLNK